MNASADFALVGTGVAPLIAARILLERGSTVAILNPERDFFLEESELPLDPILLEGPVDIETRLRDLDPHSVLEALKPAYPGALEVLPRIQASFFDGQAPWVRTRAWTWVGREGDQPALESLFSKARDRGLAPINVSGETVKNRMPGAGPKGDLNLSGVTLSRCADAEVTGYRAGIADFLKEKLGELWIHPITRLEISESGDAIRFWREGVRGTLICREKIILFVTPQLERLSEMWLALPTQRAGSLWEEWSLVSRESLDPSSAFVSENMLAYCPSEQESDLLRVLRRGAVSQGLAGEHSFRDLWALCRGLLGWERFSMRSLKPRRLLSNGESPQWVSPRTSAHRKISGIYPADGALSRVVAGVTQRIQETLGATT